MKFKLCVFLTLVMSINTYSQVGGENVFQFLNLATSARQLSLGGEVLTLIDDVNQPIFNPSVINPELDAKIGVNYSSFLAGVNIGSVSYAKQISRRFGTIAVSATYLDYGTIIGADAQGIETGNFNANDLALSIGYSYNLPWTNLFMGTNLKMINSNISTFTSFGVAFDVGLLYFSPYKSYSITLVARNMGTQLKSFSGEREKLPFTLALGASYKLEYVPLKWYLTVNSLQQWGVSEPNPSEQTTDLDGTIIEEEIGFINNALRHVIIGAELFPESIISVRLGYNFRRAAELKLQNLRTFGGVSFGFGIQMNRLKFDYAFSKYHSATNASTFSLTIDLNKRY